MDPVSKYNEHDILYLVIVISAKENKKLNPDFEKNHICIPCLSKWSQRMDVYVGDKTDCLLDYQKHTLT